MPARTFRRTGCRFFRRDLEVQYPPAGFEFPKSPAATNSNGSNTLGDVGDPVRLPKRPNLINLHVLLFLIFFLEISLLIIILLA